MVRTYKRMTGRGSYGEINLQNALVQIRNGMPLIRASKEFRIPARTLRRHRDNAVQKPGTLKLGRFRNALPDHVELQLKNHIIDMERKMYGLTYKDIQKLSFDLVEKLGIDHPFNKSKMMAGKDWVQGFLRRHGLVNRQAEGTSISRAIGFNRGQVNRFFSIYKDLLEAYRFPPCRIWNADETGLTTVQSVQKVITKRGSKSVGKMTSAERGSLVTMLCACNATGCFLPPMYIFRRKRMVEPLMAGAPAQSIGFPSKSGWIDQDLFLKWLEHFTKFANPSRDSPHLIILDGHHSHKTLAAVDYCRSKGIILLTLPPHSTHKMQPLDRTYFKSLKAAFNTEADKFMVSNPGRRITIYDMARLSGAAFTKTAVPEKAINGFKSCGLVPIDSQVFSEDAFHAVPQYEPTTEGNQNPNSDGRADPSEATQVTSPSATSTEPDASSAKTTSESTPTTADLDGKGNEHMTAFRLIPTVGDGRCLFRSLAIGMNQNLQTSERDADGTPINPLIDIMEKGHADDLRSKMINYFCENLGAFDNIKGDAVNADLPPHIRYSSLQDRIVGMADPLSMPGEIEITNLCKAIKHPIHIIDNNGEPLSSYGDNDGFQSDPLFVQFTKIRDDVGHYDCLLRSDHGNSLPNVDKHLDNIKQVIHSISPIPLLKRAAKKKNVRKQESSEVITSSPYKRVLELKDKTVNKKQKCQQKTSKPATSKLAKKKPITKHNLNREQDWACIICDEMYSNTRPREIWVECQLCRNWAHEECTQGLPQFICPNCE